MILTTARNRMLLAEFDYTMKPHPAIALIDTKKERYDMGLLNRYGLPFMYWNLMLKGPGLSSHPPREGARTDARGRDHRDARPGRPQLPGP